jgi:hypothetical protein
MPRFIVAIADCADGEMSVEIIEAVDKPAAAIKHSWITHIYRDERVVKNLHALQIESVRENFKEILNWSLVCRNLDNAIMSALNGGDSSVSELPLNS